MSTLIELKNQVIAIRIDFIIATNAYNAACANAAAAKRAAPANAVDAIVADYADCATADTALIVFNNEVYFAKGVNICAEGNKK